MHQIFYQSLEQSNVYGLHHFIDNNFHVISVLSRSGQLTLFQNSPDWSVLLKDDVTRQFSTFASVDAAEVTSCDAFTSEKGHCLAITGLYKADEIASGIILVLKFDSLWNFTCQRLVISDTPVFVKAVALSGENRLFSLLVSLKDGQLMAFRPNENHDFVECQISEVLPEFVDARFPDNFGVIIHLDTRYVNVVDQDNIFRISACGTHNGKVRFAIFDVKTNSIAAESHLELDLPISGTKLTVRKLGNEINVYALISSSLKHTAVYEIRLNVAKDNPAWKLHRCLTAVSGNCL